MKPAATGRRAAGAGALMAAVAYSLSVVCCLPIAVGAAGVTLAAASNFLGPLQPYLAGGALSFLAVAAWRTFRCPRDCSPTESCAPAPRRRFAFLLLAAMIAVLLSIRFWLPLVLTW